MIGVRFLILEWYAMERRYLDFVRVKAVDKKGLDKALLRYVERTVQEHPEVVAIILYGSFPKGTFTPQSDIDLLIVLKESREGILDRIPHFLDLYLPFPSDVLPYTVGELRRLFERSPKFKNEILSSGQILFGGKAFDRLFKG